MWLYCLLQVLILAVTGHISSSPGLCTLIFLLNVGAVGDQSYGIEALIVRQIQHWVDSRPTLSVPLLGLCVANVGIEPHPERPQSSHPEPALVAIAAPVIGNETHADAHEPHQVQDAVSDMVAGLNASDSQHNPRDRDGVVLTTNVSPAAEEDVETSDAIQSSADETNPLANEALGAYPASSGSDSSQTDSSREVSEGRNDQEVNVITRQTTADDSALAEDKPKDATDGAADEAAPTVDDAAASSTALVSSQDVEVVDEDEAIQTLDVREEPTTHVNRSVGRTFRAPSSVYSSDTDEDAEPIQHVPVGLRALPVKGIVVVKTLGEGGNGLVQLVRYQGSAQHFAVKENIHGESKYICQEAELQARLKFPHILDVIGYIPDPHSLKIVLEYCEDGDLLSYRQRIGGRLSVLVVCDIFYQIACALAFLHEGWDRGVKHTNWKTIVHNDLKPENILVSWTGSGSNRLMQLKIADFGAAVFDPDPKIPMSQYSTPYYAPPEATERFSAMADMWAFGCTIHLLTHDSHVAIQDVQSPWRSQEDCWDEEEDALMEDHRFSTVDDKKFYCGMRYIMSRFRHVPVPLTIDHTGAMMNTPYPKFLSYLMMRALEINDKRRISAIQVHKLVPVFCELYRCLEDIRHQDVLETFDDGIDRSYRRVKTIGESQAVRDICSKVRRRLYGTEHHRLIEELLQPLREYMNPFHRNCVDRDNELIESERQAEQLGAEE